MPLEKVSLISPSFGPSVTTGRLSAEVLNTWPIGALEKYGSVAFSTAGSAEAVELEGKCCAFVHISTCCAGAVSHLIRSYACC